MKRIITAVSLLIIAAFVILTVISLIPSRSREDAGEYIPEVNTSSPTHTDTEENTTPTPTVPESPDHSTVPNVTLTVTPPPSANRIVFSTTIDEENKNFDYDNETIAKITFYAPTVISNKNTEAIGAINQHLKIATSQLMDGYSAEAQQFIDDYDPSYPETYTCNVTSKIYHSDKILSVYVTAETSYGRGNFLRTVFCYNYSISTGAPLTLDDVVKNKPALISDIISACEKITNVEFTSGYKNYVSTNICNEWYVNGDTFVMVYKPYEIAPGSAGVIEIPVSDSHISM